MEQFLEALAQVSGPLAVAGLLASLLFYAVREVIRARLIPALPRKHALPVILSIINKLFILSLVALVFGIAAYVLERSLLAPKSTSNRMDGWAVKVYDFENYGSSVGDAKIGERFSGLILDALLRRDLDARAIPGTPPEGLDFEPTRGAEYRNILEEFEEVGPFISVTGFVESGDNRNFFIHVRVSSVNAARRIRTLMAEELAVPRDHEGMRMKATELAGKIYSILRNQVPDISQTGGVPVDASARTTPPVPGDGVSAQAAPAEQSSSEMPLQITTSDTSIKELIDLLSLRAKEVSSQLDKEADEIASLASCSIEDPSFSECTKLLSDLGSIKDQFLELHAEHLNALRRDQRLLAHEINDRIQRLLLVEHRRPFLDLAQELDGKVATPNLVYAKGWGRLVLGEQELRSIEPWLQENYPGPIPEHLREVAIRAMPAKSKPGGRN